MATSSNGPNCSTLEGTPQRISSLKTFLASDEPIQIIPIFSYKTQLSEFLVTQRNVGPFVAGETATVPLWLGIYLRKRNLCRLVAPYWLNVQHLKGVLAHERDPNKEQFSQELPFRYLEISRSILQTIGAGRSAAHASGGGGAGVGNEEIPQVEIIRVLLEDISTVRRDKIRRNIHTISAEIMGSSMERPVGVVDVSGIGAAEMAAVKPFLGRAFEDHLRLVRSGTGRIENQARNAGGHSGGRLSGRRSQGNGRLDEEQQQQEQYEGGQEDDLMEPTADEQPNGGVSRVRVRRYR